jgi:hypothetical protein
MATIISEGIKLNDYIPKLFKKYPHSLLQNFVNIQELMEFEFGINVSLEQIESYFIETEDYERESRKIEWRN